MNSVSGFQLFEENPMIEMPDAELLEIVKRTLKEFPNEKILAFFRNPAKTP